jgi:hypothetical protein
MCCRNLRKVKILILAWPCPGSELNADKTANGEEIMENSHE